MVVYLTPRFYIVYVFLLIFSFTCLSQTTITYRGPNTWGGPYVAPVWSKTYKDFSVKPSTYYTPPAAAANYKGNTSGNGADRGSSSKRSFGSNIGVTSYEERMKLEAMRTENANTQAKEYFDMLNRTKLAIYNDRAFYGASYALASSASSIYKATTNKNPDYDASDEYLRLIRDFIPIEEYYTYLCDVKTGKYENAFFYYNLRFTKPEIKAHNQPVETLRKPLALTGENYYFMNELKGELPDNFTGNDKLQFTFEERLRIDLYFVQTLLFAGYTSEAKLALKNILRFYDPLISDQAYNANELAIIYFMLGEMDLSQMEIELYCEKKKSNSDRYYLISELIYADGWSGKTHPKAEEFLVRNLGFLEQVLLKESQLDSTFKTAYFDRDWYKLYVDRVDNAPAFIQKKKAYFQSNISEKLDGYTGYDLYLTALLKVNDTEEINWLLKLVKAEADRLKQQVEAEKNGEMMALLAKYKGRAMPDKSDYYKMDHYNSLWERYYSAKADPVAKSVLEFTHFKNFLKEGGAKYINPLIKDELEFLSNFTEKEITWSSNLQQAFGISFKKSRKYPKVFDPE